MVAVKCCWLAKPQAAAMKREERRLERWVRGRIAV